MQRKLFASMHNEVMGTLAKSTTKYTKADACVIGHSSTSDCDCAGELQQHPQ